MGNNVSQQQRSRTCQDPGDERAMMVAMDASELNNLHRDTDKSVQLGLQRETEARALTHEKRSFNFLLVGQCSAGKSSTGNSILQLTEPMQFPVGNSTASWTKRCRIESSLVLGSEVAVTDLPGFGSSDQTLPENLKYLHGEMMTAISHSPHGYDAILIVTSLEDGSKREIKVFINILKEILGPDAVKKFGILVVTHGDTYDAKAHGGLTFEKWCSKQTGSWDYIRKQCGGRVVLFDNVSQKEDIRKNQVEKLFLDVENMEMKYSKRPMYTSDMFFRAQNSYEHWMKRVESRSNRTECRDRARRLVDELRGVRLENDLEEDHVKLGLLKQTTRDLLSHVRSLQQTYGTGWDTHERNRHIGELWKNLEDLAKSIDKSVDKIILIAITMINVQKEVDELKTKLAEENEVEETVKRQWQREKLGKEKLLGKMRSGKDRVCAALEKKCDTVFTTDGLNSYMLNQMSSSFLELLFQGLLTALVNSVFR